MKERNQLASWILCSMALLAPASVPVAGAQAHPATAPAIQAPSEQDVAATQEQLLKLLRLSPVLTTVVARDPSLLADQQYVQRNNPELAQFIASHPDIAKNPEFYLFSHLEQGRGRRDQALERAVWPDLIPADRQPSQVGMVVHEFVPLIGLPIFFFMVFLIIRLFVESRRWNRTFKLQSEVHSRLIDKFTSSQDLAAYMQTEAGKSFLAASPVTLSTEVGMPMPNVVARVLTPLTVGIVMVLSGLGFIAMRGAEPDTATPMLVLGTLCLMPGVGLILSAWATWIVGKRLGMLPEKEDLQGATPPQLNTHDQL